MPALTVAELQLIPQGSTAQACKHTSTQLSDSPLDSLRQEILEYFEVQKQHSTPYSPKAELLHQARSPAFIY